MLKSILLSICLLSSSFLFAQNIEWTTFLDTSTTFSSPRCVDLNNDGIKDIVIGGGIDGVPNSYGVNALDGTTGNVLWNFPSEDEIFGSATFQDISGDNIPDVFIGGRYGEFYAINGSTGAMIWEYFPYSTTVALDSGVLNFYSPQLIPDQNNDSFQDILVANGGNHSAPAWDTLRPPGSLMVIDAFTGNLLAKDYVPDFEETYCSPIVVDFLNNGNLTIVYGSGGENDKGSLWRVPLSNLMTNDISGSVQLASDPNLGFIAPPSVADMNDDGFLDIVAQGYNGTLYCFNGVNNSQIWQVSNGGTESSAAPVIGNFIGDKTPDIFAVLYKGAAPTFTDFYQILIDGQTGNIVWKDSISELHFASANAVDLDLNGRDEAIISVNYHMGTHFEHQLKTIDFQNNIIADLYIPEGGVNLGSTPLIEDIDNDGLLDFVFAFRADSLNPMGQNGFHITRLEGSQTVPGVGIAWGDYMGTNDDGHYNYTGTNCGTVFANLTSIDKSCNFNNDGSASVAPSGGVSPYSYLWSNGEITSSIDSLAYGNYSVIVTDSTGCYDEITFLINNPTLASLNTTNISCNGLSDGSITVNSSGGTTPYTYTWSNGDTTATIDSLAIGNYSVTVVDANGCTQMSSASMYEPFTITFGGIIAPACPGDSTGQAQVNSSGCPCMFSGCLYDWTNGSTIKTSTGLWSGWHVVEITHLNGCIVVDSVEVPAALPILDTLSINHLNCATDSTGRIELVLNNPSITTINWSNGSTSDVNDKLVAGDYILNLTDTRGCSYTDTLEVLSPDTLFVNHLNTTDVVCFGDSSGVIELSVNGGLPSYTFNWSNGSVSNPGVGFGTGYHSVDVTDSLLCTVTMDSIFVVEGYQITTSTFVTHENNDCSGTGEVTILGGFSPFSFLWTDSLNTSDSLVTNLCDGVYYVTVTDSNGCSVTDSINVFDVNGINTLNIDDLSIYPNPNNGVFKVQFNTVENYTELKLINAVGQLVYTTSINREEVSVNLASIAKGTYFLLIYSDDRLVGRKQLIVE